MLEIDTEITLRRVNGLDDGFRLFRVDAVVMGHHELGCEQVGELHGIWCPFVPPSDTGLIGKIRSHLDPIQDLGFKAMAQAATEPTLSLGWMQIDHVEISGAFQGKGYAKRAAKDLIEAVGDECILTVPVDKDQAQAVCDFGISDPLIIDGQLFLWADTQYRSHGYLHAAQPIGGEL